MNIKSALKYYLPSYVVSNCVFFKNYKRFINYSNPKFMDEMFLIAKDYINKDISIYADKYKVRDFVIDNGYNNILKKLLAVYQTPEDIDFDSLPKEYVIKCNHGCGYNIIIRNKNIIDDDKNNLIVYKSDNINRNEITYMLNKWLKEDYGKISGEKHYSKIRPLILIEEFTGNKDGTLPIDYKFYVNYGKVIGARIVFDRDNDKKDVFVDANYHLTNYLNKYKSIPNKPDNWDTLLKIASDLGKKFPIVRVDLNNINDKPVFGELTFTPEGCIQKRFDIKAQEEIGSLISLDI